MNIKLNNFRILNANKLDWRHRFEDALGKQVKEKRLAFCHEFRKRTRVVLSNVGQGNTGGGLVGKTFRPLALF